jgi:hypothetical protein
MSIRPDGEAAPLSELIMAYIQRETPRNFARFLKAFRVAEVGVHAGGIPEGVAQFTSTAEHPISAGTTDHGGQGPLVLTYADPLVFARHFGMKFNAGFQGEAALKMVLLDPTIKGVLVNCALAKMSVMIDRETAVRCFRPWWRIW